jgi:hypothetical protein
MLYRSVFVYNYIDVCNNGQVRWSKDRLDIGYLGKQKLVILTSAPEAV